jgi:hypothetical protein
MYFSGSGERPYAERLPCISAHPAVFFDFDGPVCHLSTGEQEHVRLVLVALLAPAAGVLRTRQAERSGESPIARPPGPKGPPVARGRRRVGAEHSTGPQLVKVGETDSGECVEEVGLGRAHAVRVLGASAKGAAGCHAIIVWATTTAPSMQFGYVIDGEGAG